MFIEYDTAKSAKNERERQLSFERAHDFLWESAFSSRDSRQAYSEARFVAIGLLDGRLHVLCYTPLADGVRIISLRKANKREQARYDRIKKKPRHGGA